MTTWPVVAATGHRPQHLSPDAREWIRPELDRVAVKLKVEHETQVGISGMAIGVDQWWTWPVLRAGLKLVAIVPFRQQPERWQPEDRDEWHALLRLAAHVHYVGDLAGATGAQRRSKTIALLHARNDYMLDEAVDFEGAVVAVHRESKTTGGTAGAVKKAKRRGLPIIHLDPDTQTVRLMHHPVIGSAA